MSGRIVIASEMGEAFDEQLRAHVVRPEVIAAPADAPWLAADEADVLLVRPTPAWQAIAAREDPRPAAWPGRLRWVGSASVGVDFYPRWLFDAPAVTCGRGVASAEIADYVIAAIFLHAKDLEGVRARSAAEWRNRPLGRIAGTTVGIVGLGGIGQAVARRALALGMRVVATRRRTALANPVEGARLLPDLQAVVAAADHLVLALPATAATRGLIDAQLLAQARPGAHLINVARGSIVDHAALLDALDHGPLAFATLDVTDPEPLPEGHPLWTHPAVRLTPHVSSNHTLIRDVLLARTGANIHRFVRGEPLHDLVDGIAGY
jgi:phosphoglycerate dehydrogenase-like enzyme